MEDKRLRQFETSSVDIMQCNCNVIPILIPILINSEKFETVSNIFLIGGYLPLESMSCERPVPLQSPETQKPQKCIFLKSEKCHFRPPGKMAPPKVN